MDESPFQLWVPDTQDGGETMRQLQEALAPPAGCLWRLETPPHEWLTACGRVYELHQTPLENAMWFCPTCGQRLRQETLAERQQREGMVRKSTKEDVC